MNHTSLCPCTFANEVVAPPKRESFSLSLDLHWPYGRCAIVWVLVLIDYGLVLIDHAASSLVVSETWDYHAVKKSSLAYWRMREIDFPQLTTNTNFTTRKLGYFGSNSPSQAVRWMQLPEWPPRNPAEKWPSQPSELREITSDWVFRWFVIHQYITEPVLLLTTFLENKIYRVLLGTWYVFIKWSILWLSLD